MKRLAALFLAVWLLLLMGCAASRQLEQVCGAENWSSVQLVERYDRAGEEAMPLSPDAVSPEALRALLREAYAKPAYASAQLPVPCIPALPVLCGRNALHACRRSKRACRPDRAFRGQRNRVLLEYRLFGAV